MGMGIGNTTGVMKLVTKLTTLKVCTGEQPISAQIRAVANLCKYKYKNIFLEIHNKVQGRMQLESYFF